MANITDAKKDRLNGAETMTAPEEKQDDRGPPPEDSYYVVKLMVLTLGLTSTLAATFITTANDYWMYKFRDPSSNVTNSTTRTKLQSVFTSSLMVAMAVPAVIGLVFVLTYAQKIKPRTRINGSYGVLVGCFLLLTMFVGINTDDWQVEFFVITMGIMGFTNITFVVLTSSLITSIPKLPLVHLKLFMYGQGVTGIFSATLQIISLAIGKDPTSVAFIYFGSGTLLYAISFGLYFASKYMPYFEYYVPEGSENVKRPMPSAREMWDTLRRMWPIIAVMGLIVLGQTTTHPNITSLIVSENKGDMSAWSEKYFVAVITFFLADVVGVVARFFSSDIITSKNHWWFIIISLTNALIFPPLFIYCNTVTSDRTVDRAVFTHDWQYIIILSVFVTVTSYMQTTAVLSLKNYRREGEVRFYTIYSIGFYPILLNDAGFHDFDWFYHCSYGSVGFRTDIIEAIEKKINFVI